MPTNQSNTDPIWSFVEAKRELSGIWEMTKADPLSPISYYFRNMVLPGAGLGLEG